MVYVADGVNGKQYKERFYDFITRDHTPDTRTGDQIAKDIIERHGLRIKD